MDEATGETETQDLMNVESFSQLPFIRRPPSKDKNPKPIRLFGKDFSGTTDQEPYSDSSETKNHQEEEENQTGDNSKDLNNTTNNRRFECHYCFRNFPTSQALGGHQNAHKRERQLAKRGASASSYFHHHDTNVYGYRHYPSWTSSPLPMGRSYGGLASGPPFSAACYTRPPINRSSLGLWRVPPSSSCIQGVYNSTRAFTNHNSSNSALPLLAGSQTQPPLQMGGSEANRYGLSPNVQDNVSLDLHL